MGKTFWVDQLQFTPPQGSSVGNGTNVVLVDFFDPAIVYGDGWESLGSSARMTSIYGSKLAFNFTGPFLTISKPSESRSICEKLTVHRDVSQLDGFHSD